MINFEKVANDTNVFFSHVRSRVTFMAFIFNDFSSSQELVYLFLLNFTSIFRKISTSFIYLLVVCEKFNNDPLRNEEVHNVLRCRDVEERDRRLWEVNWGGDPL